MQCESRKVFCARAAQGVYFCTRPKRRGKQNAPLPSADTTRNRGIFALEQLRECTFVHDQSGEVSKTADFHRRMQCEARSCFAYEQLRECTTVHDRSSAVTRHEIVRNASVFVALRRDKPPPVVFLLYACYLPFSTASNFALSASET